MLCFVNFIQYAVDVEIEKNEKPIIRSTKEQLYQSY